MGENHTKTHWEKITCGNSHPAPKILATKYRTLDGGEKEEQICL